MKNNKITKKLYWKKGVESKKQGKFSDHFICNGWELETIHRKGQMKQTGKCKIRPKLSTEILYMVEVASHWGKRDELFVKSYWDNLVTI